MNLTKRTNCRFIYTASYICHNIKNTRNVLNSEEELVGLIEADACSSRCLFWYIFGKLSDSVGLCNNWDIGTPVGYFLFLKFIISLCCLKCQVLRTILPIMRSAIVNRPVGLFLLVFHPGFYNSTYGTRQMMVQKFVFVRLHASHNKYVVGICKLFIK